MYQVDPALAAALASGAPALLLRLTALWPDGTVRQVFDLGQQLILSGAVTAELRRDVRRAASLELRNDGTLAPSLPTDLFAKGSRASIAVGAIANGAPMLVPVIAGFVTASRATMRGPTLSVALGSHLVACNQDAGEPLVLPAGTMLADALHTLWDPVLPFVEWVTDDAALERALGSDVPVLPTDDRLEVGLLLARSVGCEAYDDRIGRVVVRARQDPVSLPRVRVMAAPIDYARESVHPPVNAQAVEVTRDDAAPIHVLVEVDDPASPIHRDRIGLRVAPTIRSDTTSDPDTARALARQWLAGRALAADQGDATETMAHLDLDEGDVIERSEPVTHTSGRFRIESHTMALGPGTITLRESAVLPLFLEDATA